MCLGHFAIAVTVGAIITVIVYFGEFLCGQNDDPCHELSDMKAGDTNLILQLVSFVLIVFHLEI